MEVVDQVYITCAGGVEARMLELEQHSTYRGLLDGIPSHALNEQLLSLIEDTQGRIPTHLVRPPETTVKRTGGEPIVRLPERQCTGLFEAGNKWLSIVWFQDGWAPPIDPAVLADLRSLDFITLGFDEMPTW